MASTNKTANFNLNSWLGTDKPTRSDFNSDNELIDSILSEHIENSDVHISSEQKSKLEKPFVKGLIAGNGESSRNITFDFNPSFVIYYQESYALTEYDMDNSYNRCHSGIASMISGFGTCSSGLSLSGNKLTVHQTIGEAEYGVFNNLNEDGGQYVYIAFK